MRAAIIAFIVLAGSVAAPAARAAQLGIYAGVSYVMVEKDSTRSVFEDEALSDLQRLRLRSRSPPAQLLDSTPRFRRTAS